MRILMVGAGATGGYIGGRLAAAGRDVTFLLRPRRAAQIASHGLEILSPHGDVHLRPRLVGAGHVGGPFDLVPLSVKAFSLRAALDDLHPAVGPGTVLLPTLNGLRHVDVLRERLGGAVIAASARCRRRCTPKDASRNSGRSRNSSTANPSASHRVGWPSSTRCSKVMASRPGHPTTSLRRRGTNG